MTKVESVLYHITPSNGNKLKKGDKVLVRVSRVVENSLLKTSGTSEVQLVHHEAQAAYLVVAWVVQQLLAQTKIQVALHSS